MKRFSIIAVGAILTLVTCTVLGQQPVTQGRQGRHRDPARLFQRADANRDGRISSDEWKRKPEAFSRLDQNHDGAITQDEAQSAAKRRGERRGKRGAKMLGRLDKNNDSQITRDEWTGPAEAFDRLDQNRDRSITQDEAQSAAKRQGERRGKRGVKMLGRLDKNNDGQITRDEWAGPAEAFNRLDGNHDGVISRDELQKGRRHGKRGGDGSIETTPSRPPQT